MMTFAGGTFRHGRAVEALLGRFAFAGAILHALSPALNAQSPDTLVAPRLSSVATDGRADDWTEYAEIRLSPNRVAMVGAGTFGDDDLEVRARIGWRPVGLAIAFTWTDDVFDARSIPADSGTWIDPDGNARDRYYFFDNLAARVWTVTRFAGVWIAPLTDTGALQQGIVRDLPLRRGRASRPAGARAVGRRQDENRWFVEVEIPSATLGELAAGSVVELQIIVADSDRPGVSLADKASSIKYLTWRGAVRLER